MATYYGKWQKNLLSGAGGVMLLDYELADVRDDLVGLQLEEERLPKRIRRSSKK